MHEVERFVRLVGIAALLVTLGAILQGVRRAFARPKGRATGRAGAILRGPVYVLSGLAYFGLCLALWRPIRLTLPPSSRTLALILGPLLYFPGLALILWGRLTLGEMYNVSSGLGVQLYANHRLVTTGPYALVRHPMYLGLRLATLGGLLIYRTWTCAFLVLNAFALEVRARREEEALAAVFGVEWAVYRRRVPAWIPRVRLPLTP
ncbi:MAG: isoprenylcysteine carboxylmethyltransferase family protein [Chloroflexi bacterium]|nr:isoprenylcysteine carboxylmethyltransferase family protein [Chloroflexota bacterium]